MFDGDQVTVKPVYTVEANKDAERQIMSNAYVLDYQGKVMRPLDKDFILTAYILTHPQTGGVKFEYKDANVKAPMYVVA